MDEQIEVDVAVAGGGACGVVAALRASENPDLVVAVFEKSVREGSNAGVSSGSLAAGGTRWQREAGIVDSPERHVEDILGNSGDESHRPLVEALCHVAPEYVSWIADGLGYPMEVGADMPRKGMSVPRLHADPARLGGGPLMKHLRAALTARPNVAFLDEAPVTSLRTEDGVVAGLVAEQQGRTIEVMAGAVVLATDGFANNRDLMARHCAELGEPFYGGVSTSTGDSVAWLEPLGARFANMGACLRHGQVTLRGTRVNPALPWFGAVLVNTLGERFVDEQAHGYSGLAGVLQSQPGERAAMVWDDVAMEQAAKSEMMRESEAAGALQRAVTVTELARALRVDETALRGALEPTHGRRRLQAPFHFTWLTHGVLTTQGGAEIDTRGRVLRTDGSTVAGLRAGGGVAVGLAGERSEGYSSGNGLLAAFGMGWIIGNELAAGAP
jgi:fumarate reductase flavoprotein subunit